MHRHIIGVSGPLLLCPVSRIAASAGVMGILVGAEIIDGVVLFEDMLCAVAVMDIEINDEDLPVSGFLREARADCNVIEDAKTHGPVRLCVMPRRAHGAKGPFNSAGPASFQGLYYSAGGKERGLHRLF